MVQINDEIQKYLSQCSTIRNEQARKLTVGAFEQINELVKGGDSVYIVNAGRMNHGKSSLFNSLLGKFDEFKVQDIRTTVENRAVLWKDGTILIDTPGLSASESDNKEAYEAYRKSSLILYVHNVKIGEFHAEEINEINAMANLFDNDYFWKHFCLVLSFMESVEVDDLEIIKSDMLKSLCQRCRCNRTDLPVFCISNTRYQKGVTENKQTMIKRSGIPELMSYIERNISVWRRDIQELKKHRIQTVCSDLKQKLNKLLKEHKRAFDRLNDSSRDWTAKKNSIDDGMWRIGYAQSRVQDIDSEIRRVRNELNRVQREYRNSKN